MKLHFFNAPRVGLHHVINAKFFRIKYVTVDSEALGGCIIKRWEFSTKPKKRNIRISVIVV